MCRVPGREHEWKDWCTNPTNKKIKDESNQVISDDDSSERSSDEPTHATHNEGHADLEHEDHNNDVPKLIVWNRDADEDLMDSNDGTFTSMKNLLKLLVKKNNTEDMHFENEQEWGNLDGTDNEACDVWDVGARKSKKKSLGSEIPLSVKTNDNECVALLGLVGTWSSRSLGKREVAQTIKDAKITADEKIK